MGVTENIIINFYNQYGQMIGYKLTNEQAKKLQGLEYAESCYFNPIKDANGVYFIFNEEQESGVFDWLNNLPKAQYVPPPTPFN